MAQDLLRTQTNGFEFLSDELIKDGDTLGSVIAFIFESFYLFTPLVQAKMTKMVLVC